MTDEIQWPREIWAAERGEHDPDGRYVTSEFATVARWEGDKERDCEFQRYVDADIYDSAEKYWRARAEKAEADLPRIRAERDVALNLIAEANEGKGHPEVNPLKRRLDERNRHKEIARRAWNDAIAAAQQLAHEWFHNSGHGSPADEIATLKKGKTDG